VKLSLHRYDLPLRHPFAISRGSTAMHQALVVELEADGLRGFGEAGASDYYATSVPQMVEALERCRAAIEAQPVGDPAAAWEQFRPRLDSCPFAQCALDAAWHDLWGKAEGAPLWKLWGLSLDRLPPSDYTIGIDTIDCMVAKLEEFPGWPIYKIKLGTAEDLEIVRALRRHTDAVFRVDANCGWDVGRTIANSAALGELGVELIEQPLPAEDWPGMAEVFRRSALPIIADESCGTEADVDRCAGCFHGVNVKLVKCGGMTPARRMIARARQLGLRVMMGCMTESTVGISAAAQFLPLLDYADLDGAVLLARDVATGVRIERGSIVFPAENGCGVQLLISHAK
jgi:L-alanine-DL-glutamate epimerase-like enolase superfamily enzyme